MSLFPGPLGLPAFPAVPPGHEAIYCACRKTYPDQSNPLQVTALVKYWMGGPDPLDYISMYSNPGDPAQKIPSHWHYVSFGLSDLHGDGRVHDLQHQQSADSGFTSGFGFELTFRLKKEPNETSPPTWPAALMQALARYVFQSENILCCGDHVSWHASLDGSESRVQHMLMAEDPQLASINSPFGKVAFIQIVGVCLEELQASQQWNGLGVLELMRETPAAGGSYLITDMRRRDTIFAINPGLQEKVEQGIVSEGSNLSGVSARCAWEEGAESDWENDDDDDVENEDPLTFSRGKSAGNGLKGPSQQVHHQRDSDPNDDIDDSDEDFDEDIDGPLGADVVFPESDSDEDANGSARRRLLPVGGASGGESSANTSGEIADPKSLTKAKKNKIKSTLMKGLAKTGSSSNVKAASSSSTSSKPLNPVLTNSARSSKERLHSGASLTFGGGGGRSSSKASKCSSRMDTESCGGSSSAAAGVAKASLAPGDRFLETGVHLKFNLEAGTLLLLAFRGRLRHGRHFTFKSVLGDVAITFVTPNIVGALCTEEHPYAAHGPWLQVLLMEHMLNDIQNDIEASLADPSSVPSLPKTFRWPENRLSITIVSEEM